MNTLAIAIAVGVAVAGLCIFVIRRWRGPKASALTKRQADFWSRPGSFSLIIFDGDVREHLKGLLERCGYTLLESVEVAGEFGELCESVGRPSGANNEIVSKLVYPIWNKTVLVEPEMVMSACNPEELAEFCHEYSSSATGVIWERFSETIMLELHGPGGVTSSTTLVAGEQQEGNKSPNKELLESPTVDTLVKVLRDGGVSLHQLFGSITATKYILEEHV